MNKVLSIIIFNNYFNIIKLLLKKVTNELKQAKIDLAIRDTDSRNEQ